ncbi:hypothetical protein K474DRAFT_1655363 [Panus rudis PR-1116 ss-1]|nr:hypothetical protein K474DRAFT_1655363 [Panus rudis PR-1116 ss-1]
MSRADLNDRDVEMKVDEPSSSAAPVMNSKLDTKRRLTAKYYANAIQPSSKGASSFSFAEAVRLEQEAHAADRARKEAMEERKRRMGLPIKGEVLTRAEMDARMWAFLTYKPTDSDLEDEDEYDDSDEDDPATWFDDDQDDGRKGQDIVEPDYEDLASVIRIDESRIPQGVFYEPKDVD